MPKRNIKSLFLVRTPLQFLISVEAKEHFGVNAESSYLVLFTDFLPSLNQIQNNLDVSNWGGFTNLFYAIRKKGGIKVIFQKLLGFFKLILLLRKFRNVENIFVGHIDDVWMRFFLRRINAKNIFLLEDGVATLQIAMRRLNTNNLHFFPAQGKILKKGFFKNTFFEDHILGNQGIILPLITFFTAYEKIQVNSFDSVVENRFNYLYSNRNKTQKIVNELWFVGQPLVERNLVSKNDFIEMLNKIKIVYGDNYKYCYIIHRSEKYPEFINDLGYKVISFDNPLEIVVTQGAEIPAIIGSVNSAALMNIWKVYRDLNIKFFYSNISKEFISKNETSMRIINYYKSNTDMDYIEI